MPAKQSPPNNPHDPAGKRSRPPGLRDIAAYLNLSPATVSMAINNVPLAQSLSPETRARVLEAAKLFNYRPNLVARSLSKRESRTIGVIVPECSDGYFTRVMRGLEGALLEAGYLYFTASHLGREDLIREYPPALIQRGVDGLIFVNTPVHQHPGVPSVCVSHKCDLPGITSILVDQRSGMDQAMQHLYNLGHRRILMMRGEHWSLDAEDRYQSMCASAKRLHLATPPDLQMTLMTNQFTPEIVFRSMQPFLTGKPEFTAIFAFNDVAAIGAIRALADAGYGCPNDISVLGVDDIGMTPFLLPRITTVAQPLEAMGAVAVQHLIARLQRPEDDHAPRVFFPMSLQVRESTSMVRTEDLSPSTRSRRNTRTSPPATSRKPLVPTSPMLLQEAD